MRTREQDNLSAGRVLNLLLALFTVFAASGLLGYYVVGPKFLNGGGAPSAPAQTANSPAVAPRPPDRPSPLAEPPLKVDISEDDDASRNEPAAAKPDKAASPKRTERRDIPVPATQSTPSRPGPAEKSKEPPAPSPEPAPKKAPPEPAKAAAPPGTVYRVQVGVYSDPSRAQQVADTLKARGEAGHISTATVGGKQVWRVQAGLFKERANAEKLSQRLKSQGLDSSVVPQQEKE